MKLSILQISDLHRDPKNPIRNDVLLHSLENDRARYALTDDPKVRTPDIVIVSGDIIQGVLPGTADPDAKLAEQYAEALQFLGWIADRFAGGDPQRVVIVPGNHDVSACHFIDCVQRVTIHADRKKELVSQLFAPNSPLRWSWSDLELFEITDQAKYERRISAFATFYDKFYAGGRVFDLDPGKQFDLFDFPQFETTIAAFSSCWNNDFFNHQGSIHPACIAGAAERLQQPEFRDRLRLAVWHHNTEGLPAQSDYMDPDILQNLIDSGFSIGFHGHQHRPQFLDTRFRYGGDRRITVISAGTLCGGASFRHGRAYNVVELDTRARTGKLHLREMQNDNLLAPIWGRRALPTTIANFLDFRFDAPPEPLVRPGDETGVLLEAQKHYENGDYRKAATALDVLSATNDLARRVLLDCLARLGEHSAIIARFDPPCSPTEVISLMDALWETKGRDRLTRLLSEPIVATTTDPSVAELRNKYSARLKK